MINLQNNVSLAGYTVIFPSVCVGNVAQLSVDLIISTLELRKVASVWHVSVASDDLRIHLIALQMSRTLAIADISNKIFS